MIYLTLTMRLICSRSILRKGTKTGSTTTGCTSETISLSLFDVWKFTPFQQLEGPPSLPLWNINQSQQVPPSPELEDGGEWEMVQMDGEDHSQIQVHEKANVK